MRQVKSRHFCTSAQWVSFSTKVCMQCVRISVEGLTVEGQMKKDRNERVNFESEQRKLLKLYRHTSAIRRRRIHEQRVLNSFGLFFV